MTVVSFTLLTTDVEPKGTKTAWCREETIQSNDRETEFRNLVSGQSRTLTLSVILSNSIWYCRMVEIVRGYILTLLGEVKTVCRRV